MNQSELRQDGPARASAADRFGPLQAAIVLLAVATAVIHLWLALVVVPRNAGTSSPDIMFLLNGLGYLGLVAALYAPIAFLRPWRPWIHMLLVGYTALTFFLWVVMGDRTGIAFFDKAIEVALIALLLFESRYAPGRYAPRP